MASRSTCAHWVVGSIPGQGEPTLSEPTRHLIYETSALLSDQLNPMTNNHSITHSKGGRRTNTMGNNRFASFASMQRDRLQYSLKLPSFDKLCRNYDRGAPKCALCRNYDTYLVCAVIMKRTLMVS